MIYERPVGKSQEEPVGAMIQVYACRWLNSESFDSFPPAHSTFRLVHSCCSRRCGSIREQAFRQILTILRLQQLDGVTQFRSTLVEFLCNRSFHLALHDLQLRERTLRFHFLEPFVEKCDL